MTFFEAYDKVKRAWPDRSYDWAFHLAVIEEAGLACEHPNTLRELRDGSNALDYYTTAPLWMKANFKAGAVTTYCPVCMTWNPKEPVDTRQRRIVMLKNLLRIVVVEDL
jgi:hypothetical protein